MRRLGLAAVLIVALAGCGAATPSQESKFKNGDQQQIAKLVDQLASAGRAGNAKKICTEILAKQLLDELNAAGGNCEDEMDRAIGDANDFDLRVDNIKVTGTTATALVRQGDSKTTATFSFIKEKGGWRASALGG